MTEMNKEILKTSKEMVKVTQLRQMKSKQKTLSNQAGNALQGIDLVYQLEVLCWGKFKSKIDRYTYISVYVYMHTSMYSLVLYSQSAGMKEESDF